MTSHYFDDSFQLALAENAAVTKRQTLRILTMFQVQVGHTKRQPMSCMPRFLGIMSDFTRLVTDRSLTVGPWPSARRKAICLIDHHLSRGKVLSVDASKLRGTMQWADLYMLGRPCRAAMAALVDRQYHDFEDGITDAILSSLLFLRFAAEHLPDHCFPVIQPEPKPLVIYTDASTEHGPFNLRVGTLVFTRDGGPALVDVWEVPPLVQSRLLQRVTQIMPAELVAIPLTILAAQAVVRNRDVIFFIDNQSAMAALIRASSRVADCSLLSLFTSLLCMRLQIRPWYEYVNTKQNPADRLSRLGFSDAHVSEHIRSGKWMPLNYSPDWDLVMGSLTYFLSYIRALGVSDN